MDAATLAASQLNAISVDYAASLLDDCIAAMKLGQINTPDRAAMFLAQIGEESVSLTATEELGSDAYLQGQQYYPYIGRTFMQITWKYNYEAFGRWAANNGLVHHPNVFVNNPAYLADPKFAWYGPVWYWTTHNLNTYADANDIYGATRVINGGLNGIDARIQRWDACKALGAALLPVSDLMEEIMSYYNSRADFEKSLAAIVHGEVAKYFTAWNGKVHVLQAFFEHYTKNTPFPMDGNANVNAGVDLRVLQTELDDIAKKVAKILAKENSEPTP